MISRISSLTNDTFETMKFRGGFRTDANIIVRKKNYYWPRVTGADVEIKNGFNADPQSTVTVTPRAILDFKSSNCITHNRVFITIRHQQPKFSWC